MTAATYGYIRVSTKEQNEDRQRIALDRCGLHVDRTFIDKQSGKDFNRPRYRQMLRLLRRDDTVVVKSIDRLGRSYSDIIEQWRVITREKGASIVVLDMPILNTRLENDLTGTLIADIVLQLLSYVAEVERDFIRQRQAEGIAAARLRGVRFGRRPKARGPGFEACLAQWREGSLSARGAARRLGVSHTTFLNWARMEAQRYYEGF